MNENPSALLRNSQTAFKKFGRNKTEMKTKEKKRTQQWTDGTVKTATSFPLISSYIVQGLLPPPVFIIFCVFLFGFISTPCYFSFCDGF